MKDETLHHSLSVCSQMLLNGDLIDVTALSVGIGIPLTVIVTKDVWESYILPSDEDQRCGQNIESRLWHTLWMLMRKIRVDLLTVQQLEIPFAVVYQIDGRMPIVRLKAVIESGIQQVPVMTIMSQIK